MISPSQDKDAIRNIIKNDNYIKRAGFKAEDIKTTGASPDIISSTNPELQIFISTGEPEKSGESDLIKNLTYDISVSGKRNSSGKIDRVAEQIVALLSSKEIREGNILYLLDTPAEMHSNPAIYIVEMTFLCQCTIYNKILN